MKRNNRIVAVMLCLGAVVAFAVAGCNMEDKKGDSSAGASPQEHKSGHDKDQESDGWWCAEHGVPEHLCSQCLPEEEVKKQFKDKGDWCKEHDRAKSQCFKCDPKRYEYFAQLYREKFKKDPPRPPESEFEK